MKTLLSVLILTISLGMVSSSAFAVEKVTHPSVKPTSVNTLILAKGQTHYRGDECNSCSCS